MATRRGFLSQSKMPLLLLAYPVFAWVLVESNSSARDSWPKFAQTVVSPLTTAIYAVVGVGFGFLLVVPAWASRYRRRPHDLPAVFQRGLYVTFALLAVILPAQGVVLALAFYVADPHELWFWGIFAAGGTIAATAVLLYGGLGQKPGVYTTLRALRILLEDHPRLASLLGELRDDIRVPLPSHILVGLQPALLSISGTVFCPEGELQGGVVCLSLPSSNVLSIPEFRALAGDALLGVQRSLAEGRGELLSASTGASDVVRDLTLCMEQWDWMPKWGFHPAFVVLWLATVAAMRFPLFLGKEWVAFYVREFWESRRYADIGNLVQTHQITAADVGAVRAVSGLIKEAALSLGVHFRMYEKDRATHALGEVTLRIHQEHPNLLIGNRDDLPWGDPVSAWKYLQFRCRLSGISLEWCRQMAMDVSPEPCARSLFEDSANLESQLLEIARSSWIVAREAPLPGCVAL